MGPELSLINEDSAKCEHVRSEHTKNEHAIGTTAYTTHRQEPKSPLCKYFDKDYFCSAGWEVRDLDAGMKPSKASAGPSKAIPQLTENVY